MTLAIGQRVEITAGLAVGKVGVILRPWPRHFRPGVPQWVVGFEGLIPQRIVRSDYLREVGT